ncbi:MAG: efflux RND transporter periplasmic adaptor subunit [Bacteroidota bacterium]
MKKFNLTSFFLILIAAILVSCQEEKKQEKDVPSTFPVVTIEKRDVTTYKEYPAVVQGVVSSEVRAKVSGYITDVLVDEGELVQKGQTLFRLETQSLNQDAASAQARVNAAQVEVEKLKPLVEKEIVSNVQLETAKANLAEAKSAYQGIQANIDYANIVSPVDGVVGNINLRNGSLVSPNDEQGLTSVSQIDEVYIYFSMNEKDFLDFVSETDGETIEEKLAHFPEIDFVLSNKEKYSQKGKIEAVSGQINRQTGTVRFRSKFSNPNRLIRDGASGKISIPTAYENSIVVPSISTFEKQNKRFVFVVENDSISEKSIEVEDATKNLYVLKNGLSEGDKIMAEGVNRVKDGDEIQPKEISLDEVLSAYKTVFK